MMRKSRILALATLGLIPAAGAQTTDPGRVRAAVDSIAYTALAGGRAAGMSIGVVMGTDTLVLKGYGSADVELDVPTPGRAVYEIGSITKQFTAAAILLLVERGKLSLDDPLTKYLPDYPMQGHTVTIRRLLDHTSGIVGYTEMREFGAITVQRLPRDTLVKLFSSRPFKFAPGDALTYNNSAYFLLGLVIEKASGIAYADFVRTNLFDKAGMADSRYCSEREVTRRRAHGYDFTQAGLMLKGFLDHTWPYAGGSLCSTVGDLASWTQALHGGRILSAESYKLLTTPGRLNDGTPLRYAMGLVNDSLGGRHAIHHSGSINGYLSYLAYFPDDQLTIAVLVNTVGPVAPGAITGAIADFVHGKPAPAPVMKLDHPRSDYVGTFRGVGRGDSLTVTVTNEGTGVRIRSGTGTGPLAPSRYVGGDTFMIGRSRYVFLREGGEVTGVRADLITVVTKLKKQ